MGVFARNKVLWLTLLLVFCAAFYAVWWFFNNRGWYYYFGRDGTSFWTVTSFAEGPVEPDTLLLLDGTQLALDVSCGQQRWGYERDESEIAISEPSGLISRCVVTPIPPIIGQFTAARANVTTLNIDDERLTMLDGEGKTVLKAQRLAARGLESRTWQIAKFQLDDVLTDTSDVFDDPTRVHITFLHNSLYGYTGCRYLVGRYNLYPEGILIDGEHHAAAFCRQRGTQLADAILAALSAGHYMTRQTDSITLKDDDGRIQVVLTPWTGSPAP